MILNKKTLYLLSTVIIFSLQNAWGMEENERDNLSLSRRVHNLENWRIETQQERDGFKERINNLENWRTNLNSQLDDSHRQQTSVLGAVEKIMNVVDDHEKTLWASPLGESMIPSVKNLKKVRDHADSLMVKNQQDEAIKNLLGYWLHGSIEYLWWSDNKRTGTPEDINALVARINRFDGDDQYHVLRFHIHTAMKIADNLIKGQDERKHAYLKILTNESQKRTIKNFCTHLDTLKENVPSLAKKFKNDSKVTTLLNFYESWIRADNETINNSKIETIKNICQINSL